MVITFFIREDCDLIYISKKKKGEEWFSSPIICLVTKDMANKTNKVGFDGYRRVCNGHTQLIFSIIVDRLVSRIDVSIGRGLYSLSLSVSHRDQMSFPWPQWFGELIGRKGACFAYPKYSQNVCCNRCIYVIRPSVVRHSILCMVPLFYRNRQTLTRLRKKLKSVTLNF